MVTILNISFHVRVSDEHPSSNWPGCYMNVKRRGVLYIVLLQLKDPLVILVGNCLPLLGVYSHRNMTLAIGVEGRRKNNCFLSSLSLQDGLRELASRSRKLRNTVAEWSSSLAWAGSAST